METEEDLGGSPPFFQQSASTEEELVQLYHFTAAGEHRDSTALGRLLDNAAGITARYRPPRRSLVLSTEPAQDSRAPDVEVVYQVDVEEEVEEEVEAEVVPSRRGDVVGR